MIAINYTGDDFNATARDTVTVKKNLLLSELSTSQ